MPKRRRKYSYRRPKSRKPGWGRKRRGEIRNE